MAESWSWSQAPFIRAHSASDGAEQVTQSNSPAIDVTVTAPAVAAGGTLGGGEESPEAATDDGTDTEGGTRSAVAAGVPLSRACLAADASADPHSIESPFLGVGATISPLCGDEDDDDDMWPGANSCASERNRPSVRPPVRPTSACVVLCCSAVHAAPLRATPRQ